MEWYVGRAKPWRGREEGQVAERQRRSAWAAMGSHLHVVRPGSLTILVSEQGAAQMDSKRAHEQQTDNT